MHRGGVRVCYERAFARLFAAAVLDDGKKSGTDEYFSLRSFQWAFARPFEKVFRSSDNLPPHLTSRNEKRRCAPAAKKRREAASVAKLKGAKGAGVVMGLRP